MLENVCTPMGQIPLKCIYFCHADSGVRCGIVSGGTNHNRSAILQSHCGLQVSLKTLNISCVCHAPHSIIRICGIACWRRNFVALSTKWTQREVEKLITETWLVVYVAAIVFGFATNKTGNFEDVFCILVFHHVVKCLHVKDLYACILCINSVLIFVCSECTGL